MRDLSAVFGWSPFQQTAQILEIKVIVWKGYVRDKRDFVFKFQCDWRSLLDKRRFSVHNEVRVRLYIGFRWNDAFVQSEQNVIANLGPGCRKTIMKQIRAVQLHTLCADWRCPENSATYFAKVKIFVSEVDPRHTRKCIKDEMCRRCALFT